MARLQHVKRGDPLTIPASTFNTFVDAARDFQQRQRSAQRRTPRDGRRRDPGAARAAYEDHFFGSAASSLSSFVSRPDFCTFWALS